SISVNTSLSILLEIDHNYINPISDQYINEIESAIPDYKKWNNRKRGYSSNLSTFNEYMTWAVFSLYVKENKPSHQVDTMIDIQEKFMVESRKFIHFRAFNQELIRLYDDQKNETGKVEIETLYSPMLKWMETYN
ncbi:MAG: DUF4932 domain-containing protein, partial [Bacteroidota bacterium]